MTMAATLSDPRRLLLAGGFALAVAAAPLAPLAAVSLPAAHTLAACPDGESQDPATGVCMPKTPTGALPSVDGIPCTGANTGECIGLSEEQHVNVPRPVVPHATVSSSP